MPAQRPDNFGEVLQEELDEIGYRRSALSTGQDRMEELVGLAFSGGGIRSATFNLGVLQALAEYGLLRHIDYLSTVSGGGYIGAWFAAWLKRSGDIDNVQQLLHPNRQTQARAADLSSSQLQSQQELEEHLPEPEPIRHLRAYSNYLAPRPGAFTADSWTLIGCYLRNLVINQLLLLPMALSVLLLVLFLTAITVNSGWDSARYGIDVWYLAAGLVAGGTAYWAIYCGLESARDPAGAGRRRFRAPLPTVVGVAGVLVTAFALTNFSSIVGRVETAEVWRWPGVEWGTNENLLPTVTVSPMTFVVDVSWLSVHVSLTLWQLCAVAGGVLHTLPNVGSYLRLLARVVWLLSWLARLSAQLVARLAQPLALLVRQLDRPLGKLSRLVARMAQPLAGLVRPQRWLVWLLARLPAWQNQPQTWLFETGSGSWKQDVRWVGSGFAAGSVLAMGTLGVLGLMSRPTGGVLMCSLVWGLPLLLVVFFIAESMQVGLLRLQESATVREWWAAFGGRLLLAGLAWAAVFAMVLYGPKFVFASFDSPADSFGRSRIAQVGAVVVWVATTLSSLRAASGAAGSPAGTSAYVKYVIAAGPIVFLIGLATGLSAALWVITATFLGDDCGDFNWGRLLTAKSPRIYQIARWFLFGGGVLFLTSQLFAWLAVDVNLFSLHELYKNRLVRCYLGASRRKVSGPGRPRYGLPVRNGTRERVWMPHPLTGFDSEDDSLLLRDFRMSAGYLGPFPLINTALNLVEGADLAWQERKAASFVLSPLHCGSAETGYRPTREGDGGYGGNLSLGQAVALSGAAVSPNMGYYSSPAITALLTVFNLRLGAWLGNPARASWSLSGPRNGWFQMLREMLGKTTGDSEFVYLSDGGHFDNLGVYELVRRKCRYIIVSDAGADPQGGMHELAGVIEKVRVDFGIRIEIETARLAPDPTGMSRDHVAVGRIRYSDTDLSSGLSSGNAKEGPDGFLFYLKPSLTGDEPRDVLGYRLRHGEFPHQTTVDQFFSEAQFESYRALGYHVANHVFGEEAQRLSGEAGRADRSLFPRVYDRFKPEPAEENVQQYLNLNEDYMRIHSALRAMPELAKLSRELWAVESRRQRESDERRRPMLEGRRDTEIQAERHLLIEMLTVLENAFYGLNLSRRRYKDSNAGWLKVVEVWTDNSAFKCHWPTVRGEYSGDFQRFIDDRVQRQEAIFPHET